MTKPNKEKDWKLDLKGELIDLADGIERWSKKSDGSYGHGSTCKICGELFHMGCNCDQTIYYIIREYLNEKQ